MGILGEDRVVAPLDEYTSEGGCLRIGPPGHSPDPRAFGYSGQGVSLIVHWVTIDGDPALPDRYRIRHLLGSGGFGNVYRAHDTVTGVDVAIKVPARMFVNTPEKIREFRREAKLASAVRHPHVARVLASDTTGDPHPPYIVMEMVEGSTLAHHVMFRGAMTEHDAARAGAELGSALGAVHAAGIVHRDIKPANVIRAVDGRVKLVDFGVATRARPPLYRTRGAGTAGYLPPEIAEAAARGRTPAQAHVRSPAADVYGLGLVIHELITGRPVFGDFDPYLRAQAQALVPRLSARVQTVSARLDTLVGHMTAIDPKDRPTAAEAAGELAEIASAASGRPSGARIAAGNTKGAHITPRAGPEWKSRPTPAAVASDTAGPASAGTREPAAGPQPRPSTAPRPAATPRSPNRTPVDPPRSPSRGTSRGRELER